MLTKILFTVFHEEIERPAEEENPEALTSGDYLEDQYGNAWFVSAVGYKSVSVSINGKCSFRKRAIGTINWKPGLRIEMACQTVQAYRARHQKSHRPMPEFSYV